MRRGLLNDPPRYRWIAYAAAVLLAIGVGIGLYHFETTAPEQLADIQLPEDSLNMSLPGIEQAIPVESLKVSHQEINSALGSLFKSAASVTVVNTPQRNPLHNLRHNRPWWKISISRWRPNRFWRMI